MEYRKYILPAAVFIALGAGLFFMPEPEKKKNIQPEALLLDIIDQSRFIHVEEVADRIIRKDPSLLLIDIRSEEDYAQFSLPGAINIPFASLLGEEARALYPREDYEIVFFGAGDVKSEQAWMIARRAGNQTARIMRGGLNRWAENIIQPTEPQPTASQEAFDLYQFQKAASQYFFGGSIPIDPGEYVPSKNSQPVQTKKVILPKRKPVVEEEEEGC